MAQEERGFVHAPEEGKAFWFLGAFVIIIPSFRKRGKVFWQRLSGKPHFRQRTLAKLCF